MKFAPDVQAVRRNRIEIFRRNMLVECGQRNETKTKDKKGKVYQM